MPSTPSPLSDLSEARAAVEAIGARARAAVIGRDDVIELALIALLADGHVLLEDYPGSGKTTLARSFGAAITDEGHRLPAFRRIQFTPDLLPSDVTGTSVFDVDSGNLTFRPGPIFAHVVLADEINRTSPKVQAAMLEAMAEKQVTVDNETHRLDDLFFVIATQNPLDVAGTYPLPTPQLDRFLFKLRMHHIERDAELAVLGQYPNPSLSLSEGLPQVTRDQVLAARAAMRTGIAIAEPIKQAMVELARRLRADERVLQGASTRSLVLMLPALQARALIRGRDFVSPEDLEALAVPVFEHRVECAPGIQAGEEIITEHVGTVIEGLARESLRR